MDVLLVQADGVDLYSTLLKSETSRGVLRFYHPSRLEFGVLIRTASLASSLSIISEIRWYIRRYVEVVLFRLTDETYCSFELAKQVYERDTKLAAPWEYRLLYGILDGRLVQSVKMDPGRDRESYGEAFEGMDDVLEVWCSESEHAGL
ncbi:hypothetical protein ABH15_10705 [Methanoculleus taiwanensis]|uniref:Uncharacterized protein n=1 Tax=Methanoculleus taiwanensis TaxID=1550565 RepID=A0A498GXI5_9EURY|nr:DUF5804 family protein [Methanoculleus taiwanensis]RXE55253.1 hypothetical protein ABH15_10705 [Methanoculleus taiwanensis]